jgi:hypothetical protein
MASCRVKCGVKIKIGRIQRTRPQVGPYAARAGVRPPGSNYHFHHLPLELKLFTARYPVSLYNKVALSQL